MISALITLLTLTVSVTNPDGVAREAEPITVSIPHPSSVQARSASIRGAGDTPWQLDDLDFDGYADELVLLTDLRPRETKRFTVELSKSPAKAEFTPGTSAYIKLHDKNQKHPRIQAITYPGNADNRQMYNSIYGHGAVLEGPYSAIRVYMDNRQSVDLYAKHKPGLELETTGFYTTKEQMEQGYGRDILWAGTSVALGSFRGWDGSQPLTIDSVRTRGQKVVASGPVRSIIEVEDLGWVPRPGARPVDMRQRYTVYAGHRDYDVEITLKGAPAGETYCTGIQKIMEDNRGFIDPDGLAGSWGNNIPDKKMGTSDTLGLGIFVPAPYLSGTAEDDVNYLTLLRPDSRGQIRYSFTSAALRDVTSPRTSDEWFETLKKWRETKRRPVEVKVISPTSNPRTSRRR